MRLTNEHFQFINQSQIDSISNDMLVHYIDFAKLSSIGMEIFGVTSDADLCDPGTELNSCVREKIAGTLWSAQLLAEQIMNFNFTPRYHTKKVLLRNYSKTTFQLMPGIDQINVVESVSIDGGNNPTSINISPLIFGSSFSANGNFSTASFPVFMFNNPNHVNIWSNGELVESQFQPGFPYVFKETFSQEDYWAVALNRLSSLGVSIFDAQNTKYLIIVAPDSVSGEPIYPGTRQKIKYEKKIQNGSDTLYFCNPGSFYKDGFNEIDYNRNEFYKLIDSVNFASFSSVQSLPRLIYQDRDMNHQSTTTNVFAEIVDAENGIVRVDWQPPSGCDITRPVYIEISYHTDPNYLGFLADLQGLGSAIAYKAAADMPLGACNCDIRKGFIGIAQTNLVDIRTNPITGQEILSQKRPAESVMGRVVFYHTLQYLKKSTKLKVL